MEKIKTGLAAFGMSGQILGVKDIQDIDLLYELHQEFMDAQKNAGTGNSEGQSELL